MLSRKVAPSYLSLYRYLNIHMYIYIYTYISTYMRNIWYVKEGIAYKDTDAHSAQLEMLSRKGAPSILSLSIEIYTFICICIYENIIT